MLKGAIEIFLGVYILLVGLGKVKVSKNPIANANFIEKWGLFFRIAGPIIAIVGIATFFSFV